jgi:6-phosphogluconolactonase (cycloisomerase 2 family)
MNKLCSIRLASFAAAWALLTFHAAAQAARAYIGTYTSAPAARSENHGEGIYLVDIDSNTGEPRNRRLVASVPSPSWIAFSPDHRFLYAISEISDYGPDKTGAVTAYAVDRISGELHKLNTVSSGGAGAAFISIHPSAQYALVANYGGGCFAVIRIASDGSLGEITDLVKPSGPSGPSVAADNPVGNFTTTSHEGSRAHMIGVDARGEYVIGDDPGRDQILVWKLDVSTGRLEEISRTASMPGSAPRHFAFAPDGKRMYQLQEQDSRLAVYNFANGHLTPLGQTVSMLPDTYEGSALGSELLMARDGRHLYAANRTQDSIAVFAIGEDGLVKRIANVPTGANYPRSLAIDPTGKFLYSLNQRGDNVTTFQIEAGGIPKFTDHYLAVGSPAVMVFLPE